MFYISAAPRFPARFTDSKRVSLWLSGWRERRSAGGRGQRQRRREHRFTTDRGDGAAGVMPSLVKAGAGVRSRVYSCALIAADGLSECYRILKMKRRITRSLLHDVSALYSIYA